MRHELTVNTTSYRELRQLSREVFEASLVKPPRPNPELERRVCMSCNSLMDGDSGLTFLESHSAAVSFISQLLRLRADELHLMPHPYSYFKDD